MVRPRVGRYSKLARPPGWPRGGASARVPSVIFANWREVLNQARLPERTGAGYALAIGGYLDYCRRNGLSVNTLHGGSHSLGRSLIVWMLEPEHG